MSAVRSRTARNAVDTWTNGTTGKTRQKNNRSTRLGVQADPNGARAYVYFGFPAPRGATLLAPTKFRLYTDGSWSGASSTITVKLLNQKWTASQTDHTDKPTSTGTGVAVTKTSTGDADVWEWDVATLLQPIADGTSWYGFEVTSNSATRRFFRSAQAGKWVPELEVSWADAPDQPTTLSPSGGIVISVEKPHVEMDYTDPTSGVLTAAQVLVSTVEAMTSPFDTGEVPATAGSKARVNLAATAYPGLTNAATMWWQGRVKDESGVWSAYSNPTSAIRYTKGSLAWNSPSGATVNDYTPTIISTFTPPATPASVTLEKWQVIVEKTSTGRVVYNSGEVPGTGNTISTVVADEDGDAVLQRGVEYTLKVRAWDSLDRVNTASDPAYVELSKAFTVTNGSTAAVTSLVATTVSNPPGVVLTFNSAAAPDSITVTVDDVPVATNATATFVSGTQYTYTLTRFRPNVSQVIGVNSVDAVNGASVATTTTHAPKVSGWWLIDRDRSRWLFIANTAGATFELGEESSAHFALGGETGVRITQSLRGYEGDMSGVLLSVSQYGRTLQEWVDEFLAMRVEPGKKRVLLGGTESFDVTTGYMTVRPTGDSSPGIRPITFRFEQTSPQRIGAEL
jgi:hypothetical protein